MAKGDLMIGKVASEFEIQAYLYQVLKETVPFVRGEVRCNVDGMRVRFDLLVMNEDGVPIYAIEVKPKRSQKWRVMWLRSRQCQRYSSLPLPVFMVCGMSDAELFESIEIDLMSHPDGIVWREQWANP